MKKLIQILTIFFLCCGCLPLHAQRWSEAKANQWFQENGWLRGCNFIPSTAINQIEMWQAETFDPVTIDRELGWAESLGFNIVRVYLHHKAWLQDKTGFKNRMEQHLAIATKHHIKTMFVFFDNCHNLTNAIGKQPDPVPGLHNSGWVTDPTLKEWEDSTYYPVLKKYVTDIMSSFRNDKRIVLWDLYNEPGGYDQQLVLMKQVYSWARSTKPSQPLTSGLHDKNNVLFNKVHLENADIITFHNYGSGQLLKEAIDTLRRYHRPIICSEYMARSNGSTFRESLPILKQEKVGAINWGLVWGKTNTIYSWTDKSHTDGSEPKVWFHDILRPDGSPYSQAEVNLIREICLGSTNMKLTPTSRSTTLISWDGGHLELNLVPMNPAFEKTPNKSVVYVHQNDKGRLYAEDMVGIVGLQLDGCPAVPRILWDNREHQFWDGFDGAFEPRNTVVNDPKVGYANADSTQVKASYYYIANYVKTTEEWLFSIPVKPALAAWDVRITTQNLGGETLKDYFNFFACYHQADTNYYWAEGDKILPCGQGSFSATADKEVEARIKQSPVTEHGHRYIGTMDEQLVQYRHPVLMSKPQPWFGGMRHVFMVEPSKCADIVTWGHQARDYMVRPEKWDLKPNESFTVTIRHVIAPVNSVDDLEKRWGEFEKDLKQIKNNQ